MRDGEKYRLGDFCTIIKGETPIKQAVPGRFPMVVTASERTTHETFQFDCRAVIVPLVSSTGHGHASIKRIHYQEGKFALGSILCAVIPKDEKKLNPQFLYVYFSYFKDQLIVPLMKGSANVSLSVSVLADLKIIVPSMDVQMRVISLSQNDALMKPLEDEIAHQQTLLGKLKQTIRQEAIQGKLTANWRATNPLADPVRNLLQRIQAERIHLIAAKKVRPGKPLAKLSANEMPFEVPEGWEWCRLGDIAADVSYGTSQKAHVEAKGIPVLRMGNITSDGSLLLSDLKYVSPRIKDLPRLFLQSGDIVFNRTNSYELVGKSGVFRKDQPFTLASYLIRVRLFEKLNPEYVAYFINSAVCRAKFIEPDIIQQNGQANFNGSKLRTIPIPLPPLPEQDAIVEQVQALTATCDALEVEIEHSRIHASYLLQAVLKEAFAPDT
jgi:type I restriction enzyme S subunit